MSYQREDAAETARWETAKQANEISTANEQLVGVQGDQIIVMLPKHRMTKDEALLHAAWLVALADDSEPPRFPAILNAVNET